MATIDEERIFQQILPQLRMRVLVVDDEPFIRDILEMYFLSCECEVELAEDGEKGLSKALEGDFDLIISDIRMPKMTGLEFHKNLIAAVPSYCGHFIFISGELDTPECRLSVEATSRPYLTKPFLPSELLQFLPDDEACLVTVAG